MCKQKIQDLVFKTWSVFPTKANAYYGVLVPQADLGVNAEVILIQVAKAIKEVHKLSLEHGIPPLIVSVEGHTNCKDPAKRSNPYHMGLSEQRAVACREYLETAGASASKPNSDREGKL